LKTPKGISQELAEVIGLLLGDGCIGRYYSNHRVNSQIVFTGNQSEYWYYKRFVRPVFTSIFGLEGHLYLRKDKTTRYHVYSKDLLSYFESLGIPVGKKNDASIPRAILEQGCIVAFLRGLYHAEGSIYRRYSKKYNRQIRVYNNLLVVQIRMKLKTLMSQIREELVSLGIKCNRLTQKDGAYTLRITDQAQVAKFLEVIRPRLKVRPHR
jgi:intein/homing endonuclease